MNGRGLSLAGGVGEVLTDLILDGYAKTDVSKVDASRFIDLHMNIQYLHERCPEVASKSHFEFGLIDLGNTFKPLHYSHQPRTARNLRMCPIHYKLRDKGFKLQNINTNIRRDFW